MADKSNEESLAAELIQGGSDMAGAAVGAAIGLVGGPVGVVAGAAGGAAVAHGFRRVAAEIRQRLLGPQEEVRIGAAAAYAGERIASYLQAGRPPREDGFFEGQTGDRPSADTLLEGVLLIARDAYEQKKVPLLGRLYANVAFNDSVSAAEANYLLTLAGALTYRQLVLLSVAVDPLRPQRLPNRSYRADPTGAAARLRNEGVALITEIFELYQRGLVAGGDGAAWISVADVNPGGMQITGPAGSLVTMMELGLISAADRDEVYTILSR